MLKVRFVGAVNGVSGSCTWLHHSELNIQFLVDCGAYQGGDEPQAIEDGGEFPFDPERIKFILLTHAHLDHCGLIPKMIENGFSGKVYATKATKEIAEIMLRDSLKISQSDPSIINEINWFLVDESPFKWGQNISILDGLKFTFLRSSHILGAVHISLAWQVSTAAGKEWKSIFFSGDVGCNFDKHEYLPIIKSEQTPYPQTDYIVIESTYGSRVREPRFKSKENRLAALWEVIEGVCLNRGGVLLIPAFSLHRTQELMCDIWTAIETFKELSPIDDGNFARLSWCIHSPLGGKITDVYSERLFDQSSNGKDMYLNEDLCGHLRFTDHIELKEFFGTNRKVSNKQIFKFVSRVKSGQKNNSKIQTADDVINNKNSIIVASSGMCNAGPIVDYIEMLGGNSNNAILMTGYQAKGTEGSKLLADSSSFSGRAEVIDFSSYYSAHADQKSLLDFVFDIGGREANECKPATVFINHGSSESKQELKNALLSKKSNKYREINNVNIATHQWFNLDEGNYIQDEDSVLTDSDLSSQMRRLRMELREIKGMLRQILNKN
ncbi:MBL fold metallo-hydrolase [Aeromonas caviae]